MSNCALIISQYRRAWLAQSTLWLYTGWRFMKGVRPWLCMWCFVLFNGFQIGFIWSSKPAHDVGWAGVINAFCWWGNWVWPWFSRLALGPTALPGALKMPSTLPSFDVANSPVGHPLWESPLTFSWGGGRGAENIPRGGIGLLRFVLHSPFPVEWHPFSGRSLGLEMRCGVTEQIKSGKRCDAVVQWKEQWTGRQEMWSQCLHCLKWCLGISFPDLQMRI